MGIEGLCRTHLRELSQPWFKPDATEAMRRTAMDVQKFATLLL